MKNTATIRKPTQAEEQRRNDRESAQALMADN
jgi:hypothetical protein